VPVGACDGLFARSDFGRFLLCAVRFPNVLVKVSNLCGGSQFGFLNAAGSPVLAKHF